MGMRVNTNQAAINAQRQLVGTSRGQVQGLERMASGLRINRAGDDAAGLAIAERFRSQVRQLEQEASNLQYGVNAARTAEGGLQGQQEGVARLRELAVQASNGTLTEEQRAAINEEAQQLIEQIDNTGQQTAFNGLNLLNGDAQKVALGTGGGEELTINESTAAALGIGGWTCQPRRGRRRPSRHSIRQRGESAKTGRPWAHRNGDSKAPSNSARWPRKMPPRPNHASAISTLRGRPSTRHATPSFSGPVSRR